MELILVLNVPRSYELEVDLEQKDCRLLRCSESLAGLSISSNGNVGYRLRKRSKSSSKKVPCVHSLVLIPNLARPAVQSYVHCHVPHLLPHPSLLPCSRPHPRPRFSGGRTLWSCAGGLECGGRGFTGVPKESQIQP